MSTPRKHDPKNITYPNRPRHLNTDEAAAYLGLAPATLVIWRSEKRYPLAYIKIGGSVRYDQQDLDDFLEARKVRPVANDLPSRER